jgi:uncharacterized repeat protein (TIGR02543 family)
MKGRLEMKVKRNYKLLSILLCLTLVLSAFGYVSASGPDKSTVSAQAAGADGELQELIDILGNDAYGISGERAFDYLSYIFLGWRTTGGHWQNQVVGNWIPEQLADAGYTAAGTGTATRLSGTGTSGTFTSGTTDKSAVSDDDYVWTTDYPISSNVWDPEYAKLEVTSAPNVSGKNALVNRINVESASFDPTSDTFVDYYNAEYGGISDTDDVWEWVTAKNANGERINVLNGEEAKLGKRAHLAWQTSFTAPKGTDPAVAPYVEGEAIYVGTVTGSSSARTTSLFPTVAEANAACAGKVLLSDSSLGNTTQLAKQAGAVAVMSTSSLNNYNTPSIDGAIPEVFTKSGRYASGTGTGNSLANMTAGKPIVEWQFSLDQKAALKELLEKATIAGQPVRIKSVSIGDIYPMDDASHGGIGQGVTVAEIKGATKPDERVLVCAHLQEPGSNDNATGGAALLEMATRFKKLIEDGKIARPERTITFLWGDEMTMATLWMNSHPTEKAKLISTIDMDMVGEDTTKTGGPMRIEKTPDPSAVYRYTLDTLPGEAPYYDATFKNSSGQFIRLPDSHTLWGAGSVNNLFKTGYYLNDLYMAVTQQVIERVDNTFRVEVCPYEGGSDHSTFLGQNIPALLTWHFTDFTYHSTADTLAMSSASEMENVDITTLGTAYMIANTSNNNDAFAKELLKIVYDAALVRIADERQNTANHRVYIVENGKDFATELTSEKAVLSAWAVWYEEALKSVAGALLGTKSSSYAALEARYVSDVLTKFDEAIDRAEKIFEPDVTVKFNSAKGSAVPDLTLISGSAIGTLSVPARTGYVFSGWYTLEGDAVTATTIVRDNLRLVAYWDIAPPKDDNTPGKNTDDGKQQTVAKTFTSAPNPTVSGTVKVGKTLTANAGEWSPKADLKYQWYAGGKAISGAANATYTVKASDLGKKIRVAVTGSLAGYATLTKTSKDTAAVKTDFAKSPKPKISGSAKVGKKLTVKVGTWSPKPSFSYQWYAGGKKIPKATKATYKIAEKYKGKKITVNVTAKKANYIAVTKTSKATAKVK